MELSIIIVNWNSKDYLKKCIASILETTHGIEYEIVVIDGGSFDGCGEMLQQSYPFVRFIQSDTNLGFAKANNSAFESSTGETLLFLNPDTEIRGAAFSSMYSQVHDLPNAGIVGARLLNSDGSIQTSCVQSFPTIINQVLDAELLRALWPKSSLFGNSVLFNNRSGPAAVEAVSGACLMIKRSVFEHVGMFSTDYFMYSEDIDLCFKAWKAGWKSYYVPTAVVVHHGGKSSSQVGESTFSSVMMLESRFRFFRKTHSRLYCWLYRLAMLVACTLRIFTVSLFWPFLTPVGMRSPIQRVLRKWAARLRWTLGGERWVRNQ